MTSRGAAQYLMCESAANYEEAYSDTVSSHATELTRLIYAYAAFENAVRTVRNSNKTTVLIAEQLISPETTAPAHAARIASRLQELVQRDTRLSQDKSLKNALEGDSSNPMLRILKIGANMRHTVAHGSRSASPVPVQCDAGAWHKGGFSDLTATMAATACVLFGIQAILHRALIDPSVPGTLNDLRSSVVESNQGTWIPRPGGGEWEYEMTAEARLSTLHLRTEDSPTSD
ncbi:hypothetical protein JWS13_39230 [Rhodococcus pseudokoreensis]|uniref:Apea-like HEPN domain-containing protein n=1 Tax=Rhodococcus pseudokoreensis TaxID=2811421 RepID=A0A974ZXN5_9NOCA|nr:hypothetical protein [Rhodococcus pseudokoreensis]QSE94209.1 hypothetical protein JWS13_39230 [Rhodococcus pseudokoreensis]